MKLFQKLAALVRRYDDTHNFTCDLCGREVFGGERLCGACLKILPMNDKAVCTLCGRKTGESGVCLECKQKPLAVSRARSVLLHEREGAELVRRFKKGEKYFCRTLAFLALPLMEKEFPDADAVTFVPMTEKAERRRGYNQSRLFAEQLARLSGKELIAPAVKKRETQAQKSLGRREREKNLEGCFAVTDRAQIKDRRILIADDTLTTGATVSELAAVFRRAGAAEVYALTATSVEKKDPFGKMPRTKKNRRTR